MVISKGVDKINRDACVEYVIESPLIKSSWLMVTPVSAHNNNRLKSFFLIFSPFLLKTYIIHNKNDVTSTLTTLRAKGLIIDGVMYLTTLKVTPNIRLARKTARCAFVVDFNT